MPLCIYIYPPVLSFNGAGVNGGVGGGRWEGITKRRQNGRHRGKVGVGRGGRGFLLSRFVKREKGRRHNCPCRQYTRCAFKCIVKGVDEGVRTTLVPNLVLLNGGIYADKSH